MGQNLVSPVFVGRRAELAALAAALEGASRGDATFVLVAGEAGVGKSRLIDTWVCEGTSEARVFLGGCVELGGDGIPFAPLVEMLRELVRRTEPDELDAILGAARPEIARLLPELGSAARSKSSWLPSSAEAPTVTSWISSSIDRKETHFLSRKWCGRSRTASTPMTCRHRFVTCS